MFYPFCTKREYYVTMVSCEPKVFTDLYFEITITGDTARC